LAAWEDAPLAQAGISRFGRDQLPDYCEPASPRNVFPSRSVVQHLAFNKLTGARQLDSNLSILATECVPRCIRNQLMLGRKATERASYLHAALARLFE
jgi:hypothetical protein